MPTPFDRFEEIDTILRRALEVDTEDRKDLVHQLCAGDPALTSQVEDLLEEAERSGQLDLAFRLPRAFLESAISVAQPGSS